MTMATAQFTTDLPGAGAPVPASFPETFDSRCLKIRDWRPSERWPQRTEPGPRPSLPLRGYWLERAGFAVGAHVRVQVSRRRLVIEVIEPDPVEVGPRDRHGRRAVAGPRRV
ncbi:MAG: SymE family type I addiction module toxin [Steroidobacteraceae bacterium]